MKSHSLTNIWGEVFYLFWVMHSAGIQEQLWPRMSPVLRRVNQLISTQHSQKETLVHVISFQNITRYATQVNRQHINIVMNATEKTHQDVRTLYNLTHWLYSSLSYQQIVLHICSILVNLRDSFYYMREVTIPTMHYVDAATTVILSLHALPVEDLRKCYYTVKKHYLQPCTYQFHQKMHFTSADTYAPTSWLQVNSSYYLLMYPYRITHNNLKYMKCLFWLYLREISLHATT